MSTHAISGQCWKCQDPKDPKWAFCPSCGVRLGGRLKEAVEPSPPDPALDMAFLYDLFSFGWYNRHVHAVALFEALANTDRLYEPVEVQEHFRLEVELPCTQAILRAKIFAEYVAQLEVFGVLCLAITKRKEQSITWTYLHAEPQEVTQFYDRVRSMGPKSLQYLLELPRLSDVKKALASGTSTPTPIAGLEGDLPQPDIERIIFSYKRHSQTIVNIAKNYRESKNVQIYNKIKHVFSLIKDPGQPFPPFNLEEYIAFALDDKGTIAPLPMQSEEVEAEVDRIHLMMKTGLELMELCFFLHQLNVL